MADELIYGMTRAEADAIYNQLKSATGLTYTPGGSTGRLPPGADPTFSPNVKPMPYQFMSPGVTATTGSVTSVLGTSGTPNQISVHPNEIGNYITFEDLEKALGYSPSGATTPGTIPNVGGPEGLTANQIYEQYYSPSADPMGYNQKVMGTLPGVAGTGGTVAPTYSASITPTSTSAPGTSATPATPTATPNQTYGTPTLPSLTPTGTTGTPTGTSGLSAEEAAARSALENAYQAQITGAQAGQAQSQAEIDRLTGLQEGIITGEVQQLLQPWREDLEKSERERLKVEENYFANQQAVDELDQLLTEGNTLIEQMKGVTGLASIRNPRIAQAMSDIAARAGVIEAVMAARNNQITMAGYLIDRSMNAIASDKNDQLQYYNTLLNFYDGQKKDERATLADLTAQERKFVDAQIGLLQNDLSRAQTSADYIKGLMINPDTANILQASGVTLNDSVEQIQAKFAQYSYREEVRTLSNNAAQNGFKYLAPGQTPPPGYDTITITDSRGQTYTYAKPIDVATSIITQNGRQVLINAKTGAVIADLGAATTATQSTAATAGFAQSEFTNIVNSVKANPAVFATLGVDQRAAVLAELQKQGYDTTKITGTAGTGYTNTQTVTAINNLDKIQGNLEPGMSGEDVMTLQNFLKSQGYAVDLTGTYDQKTVTAVTELQKKLGVDYGAYPGYFGPKTKAALGITSGGTTSTSVGLTSANYTDLQNGFGLSKAEVDTLLGAYSSGKMTLEDIRQAMRNNGVDPAALDWMMYYYDPIHNGKPGSGGGTSGGIINPLR